MNRIRLVVAGALVLALAVAGSAVAASKVLAPKKVTVTATEYAFKFSAPATAKKGQKVVVTLANKGSEVHDLKFAGVNPKSKFIAAGQKTTFTVVFKKAGRYQYICTIGEHALKGMRGVFVVKA